MPNLVGSSFNIGRDIGLVFVLNGTPYNVTWLLTETSRKSLSHMHEVIPTNYDGVPVRRVTFSGYEYDFHFTRNGGDIDNLVDQLQQNYFSNGQVPQVSLTETIRNQGDVNIRQLSGGVIVPESLGSFKGADPVNDGTLKIVFSKADSVGGTGYGIALQNLLTLPGFQS